MKYSLMNNNQVRSNGIDLLDNLMRNHEVYVEIYEELNSPLQLKGNKFMWVITQFMT